MRQVSPEVILLQVENKVLSVGTINLDGVASSSLFLIGDMDTAMLSSVFDTPPESLIIGPAGIIAAEEG
ncbi:spore germination protein PD [Paenibacillus sp. UNCCL117]|uniref:spore gernimation protein GerPD n=1 Tax=unclassified Paenibacillus TaxID=185978 RepID=UPI0008812A58|nr:MULTISPECIES: spore gernimation protein GerPD [unclassified Paenibacillus]SDC77276.1 spore germination protein PD [Paenibacillus sp. cl123]SFW25782.1 spore germination protein PD [Paenibacillus sp. UNCCL117]